MHSITTFAKRRKLLTGLVTGALLTTALAVVSAYWWSSRREDAPAAARPVPKDIHQQLSGYTFTRSDEGRQIFTIHAARTVAFKQGGTTVLEDVYVEVFGKDGRRRDVLRTRRCDYNAPSGDLFSSGTVQIELNAEAAGAKLSRAVMLETSQLYFRQQGSLLVSDEPVRYRIGPLAGSARGMSYATKKGWLELRSEVEAEFQQQGKQSAVIHLTAARARYDKERGEVMLAGPVTVRRESSRAEAHRATIFLDTQNRITRALFEGPVRASQQSSTAQFTATADSVVAEFDSDSESLRRAIAEGAVEAESRREASASRLSAEKLEVAFAGKRSEAREGTATGGVRIAQESVPAAHSTPSVAPGSIPAARKELTAEALRFAFDPDGRSLQDATTLGAGKLVLVPADAKAGDRIITAGQMLMRFSTANRLASLRGEGGTRITFQPPRNAPAGSVPQETTADHLMTVLDPATQAVTSVTQSGNFRFREGERQATAERAVYATGSETLALFGKPQIWDAEMRARATTVLIDLRNDTAEGTGKVESTHFGAADRGEPTSVLADRVVAERRGQTVRYAGHVRAWRGADVVESATLDIFRAERRIRSGSRVLTSHMQPAALVKGPAAKKETRPVTIRADHLEYFDEGRKAIYRGHVRLQTENTALEADRLDAYFTPGAAGSKTELERAVASGKVKVTQPGRRAAGEQAEYFAADGKIVLTGGPPSLYDAEKGFTSGRSLTFYSRDDRLMISGGDETKTISRHRIEQ